MADDKIKTKNANRGRLNTGLILTGIGLVFLLANFGIIPDISDSWPLFLIVIGGAMLLGALRDRNRREENYQHPEPIEPPSQTNSYSPPTDSP